MKRQRVFAAAAILGLAVMLSTGTGFAAEDICPEADDGKHVPETIVSEDYDAEATGSGRTANCGKQQLRSSTIFLQRMGMIRKMPGLAMMRKMKMPSILNTLPKDGVEYRECIYPGCGMWRPE